MTIFNVCDCKLRNGNEIDFWRAKWLDKWIWKWSWAGNVGCVAALKVQELQIVLDGWSNSVFKAKSQTYVLKMVRRCTATQL
ncbi:hypothetical protein P8452_01193 [Trifolium repens]|nr:hypothetical protein P8452_01193 [Trifolium repens]